ncbi:MAG: NAD(P)H-binding protein [Myxococcota bacterium]|nr:NAD(P)H-binding protein [Myxococcota bacterium]
MQPRFLIVGATGYTGRAVIHHLRTKQIHTVAHIRPNSPNLDWAQPEFTQAGAVVDTTSWDTEAVLQMIQRHRPTHVFSLLGTTKAKAKKAAAQGKKATYEDVERDLSLLILRQLEAFAAENADAPTPKYLFLSSLGVSDGVKNRYLRARADVEIEIRKSTLPWLIVQPSFISGPDRRENRRGERFGSVVSDTILSTIAVLGIKKPYQLYGTLSAAQLADGLIAWSLDDAAYNQTLDTIAIRNRISVS